MHSQKRVYEEVLLYAIKILVALIMFCPILWILTGGFKTITEFSSSSKLLPTNPTFVNYEYIFASSNLLLYLRNTVLLMAGNTIGTLISSALVAYPLARMEFKGRNLIFSIIVATMMIPNIALIIPQYIMFGKIGWLDSLLPMIVPSFFAYPYNVFLVRQYFRSIPKELDEAAIIDGCSRFQVFSRIIVPISISPF
ncbi:MAG: carbohydrate ABC transporter permease [Lachnospiraceae bacterium]|nr:carbohydrate ABC transporter permease [Lachnospiraceae bacterium]